MSFIQGIRQSSRLMFTFSNRFISYGEWVLVPRPTSKLEDHPLSFVRTCLFNVFAAALHSWRPSLYPQPEDTPCCGDRDPPNKVPKEHNPKIYCTNYFTHRICISSKLHLSQLKPSPVCIQLSRTNKRNMDTHTSVYSRAVNAYENAICHTCPCRVLGITIKARLKM
jgi:hypothetical protein